MAVVNGSTVAGLSYDVSDNSAISLSWSAAGTLAIYRALGDLTAFKSEIEAAALTSTFLNTYPAFTKLTASAKSFYTDKDVLPGVGSGGSADVNYADDRTYTYVVVDSATPTAHAQLFKVVYSWNSKALVQNFDEAMINALKAKSQNSTPSMSFKIALSSGYNYIVAISSDTDIGDTIVNSVEDAIDAKVIVVADGDVAALTGYSPVLSGTWQLKYQSNV